jgi:hypothetical protein
MMAEELGRDPNKIEFSVMMIDTEKLTADNSADAR